MMLPPVGHGYGVTSYALQNLNLYSTDIDAVMPKDVTKDRTWSTFQNPKPLYLERKLVFQCSLGKIIATKTVAGHWQEHTDRLLFNLMQITWGDVLRFI
ncbi:hypothetical protein Ahy_A04g021589 isoform B [Arachis hypogaea]|uniref:Uncharacterized protein n=1 Tax=Arachis hypogaea TaxID=3818 RepID=A0A445DKY6_ARAHY|nr:hypothetical protein Ahy_A04g021589 isoform B [Arachis hypogaea]